jgi:hypothetical protein
MRYGIYKMSEPIVWMHTNSKKIFKTEKPNEFDLHLFTPLYTHPMCELSDEEIEEVWYQEMGPNESLIDFARAILKKASEK